MNIYDAFISYRRSDGLEIAENLYRYLTARGLRVFFDKQEMIDSGYFTTQIENSLLAAPNYILIATNDVFRFRDGEDWVRREIEIAIERYEELPLHCNPVVLTLPNVCFPEKKDLPESVKNIVDVQRIMAQSSMDTTLAFDRVLSAITQVSHQNLWNAAHRWTEKSKQPGGRFANLNISQSILPGARKEEHTCKIPVQVTLQPEEQSNHKMLFDALSETTEHLFLIGQGGIGKTTALMYLMQNAYENRSYTPNVQVPIFVELSFAPDTYNALYDDGKSSFIRRSIYKQLRTDRILQQVTNEELSEIDEAFMLPYKVAVAPINDILTQRCPAPEYLLLLDGLNEVSSVYIEEAGATVAEMVSDEIILLMTRCPNVRVVITSRTDDPLISNLPVTRFYLSGVEKETIRDYLLSNGISDADARLENSALLHVLQIPLFLSIYATLTNRENITTPGEIFRTFFHERRKNIYIYTVQNRLDAIEQNVIDSAGRNQPNRLTAEMQQFALDFLLPELAWYMERNNLFYLRPKQIEKIFLPVLTDTSDEAICGDFGKDVFTKFHKGGAADMHTGRIAKDILQCLGLDATATTEKLINCCVHALGILQCSSRKYGFIHQHIRAYFAAVKCMNTLRLAAYLHEEGETESARSCMNTVFAEAPVPFHVRCFLGEALGEHQNPLCRYDRKRICKAEDDRLLIQRALDIYRHQFNGENGYTLYSLLCTAIQVRGYLAGYDLSHLDLTGCPLNGAGLSQKQIPANMSGAKIRQEDLFFRGHTDPIQQMDISQDGTMILTGSWDGLKIWDIRSGQLIKSVETSDALMLAAFVEEDTQLLAVTHTDNPNTVSVKLFDFTTGEISRKSCDTFDLRQDITRVQLSPDRKHLLFVTRYGQKPTLHHSESVMSHTYALWYERNLMNRRKKLQLTDPVYRGVVQILTVPDLNPVWTKKYESDRIIDLDAAFFPTGDQTAISIRYSHSIWDTNEPEYEDSCNITCVVLPEGTETTLLQLPATPKIHITEDSNFLCWTPEHLKLFTAENGS